jgi:hypothetical protein
MSVPYDILHKNKSSEDERLTCSFGLTDDLQVLLYNILYRWNSYVDKLKLPDNCMGRFDDFYHLEKKSETDDETCSKANETNEFIAKYALVVHNKTCVHTSNTMEGCQAI